MPKQKTNTRKTSKTPRKPGDMIPTTAKEETGKRETVETTGPRLGAHGEHLPARYPSRSGNIVQDN
jgi:hypothetical protein